MTTEVISQTLTAGQQATFGQGRVWYLKTLTGPVSIVAEKKGTGANVRRFTNVGAGFKFTAPVGEGWDYLRVTSASTQAIEIVIGDDDIEVANAVSITGTAAVQIAPASALTNAAPVACANAAQTAVVAVNATRRRVGLSILSTVATAAAVFVRSAGGTQNLCELQPGILYTFEGTYGLDVRNDSGASVNVMVLEES